MTPYQVDGIDLDPQPVEHEWDYPIFVANDGDGAPFYARYNALSLRCSLTVDGHFWYQWADGAMHTVRVPEPGTPGRFADYTSVYIQSVKEGVVLKKTGMRGVEMRVIRVTV